jgi:menaquinone-9 beta-reductase
MTVDVIVVGGGPAGSASAALFAEQGRRVLLLDAAQFPRPKACAEYISPGGAAILERLGVLSAIEAGGQRRWLRGMYVTAPSGAGHLVEYVDQGGDRRHGLSLSRLVLDTLLLDHARACGAEIREHFRVRGAWHDGGRVRGVIGPAGERLSTDLVVGADGLHSVVARSVGATRRVRWPRRLGLIAHFEGVTWPEDYGRLQVGRRGYVGVAPLDEQGLVSVGLVDALPPGRLRSPVAALEAGLVDHPELSARLREGTLLGRVMGVGPLASRVKRVAGPGYALVGDAAGFFDPFTGEGIFRALHSAELLANGQSTYPAARRSAFLAKQRLVALIQAFVQTPRLMDFAVRRLQSRPAAARELGSVLGDLRAPSLGLVWRLLGP